MILRLKMVLATYMIQVCKKTSVNKTATARGVSVLVQRVHTYTYTHTHVYIVYMYKYTYNSIGELPYCTECAREKRAVDKTKVDGWR